MSAKDIDSTHNLLTYDGLVIKIKEKLTHMNACAGAEGTADFYMCELCTPAGETVKETVLCIFIARFEEFSVKLVSKKPENFNNANEIVNDMLRVVEEEYVKYSANQRLLAGVH